MVFAIALTAVTAIAPSSSVVTVPMLTKMGSGAVGATAGTVAGVVTNVGTAAATAGVGTASSTAGAIAIKATAGVTGAALTGVNIAMGPPGWIVLGKSAYSWTCWKKIIHDDSDSEDGVPLAYIFQHDNVKSVSNHDDYYKVENVWGEEFKIYFVKLPNGDIAAHAE